MEWKKIRQKTFLLLCMTVVLFFLLIRAREGEPGKKGERAEILEIPEGEYVEEPEEIWSLPGADATIRVLLLAEDGGLFHEKQELDKEYAGELEYYEEENGWVIVNELPLEEYLRFNKQLCDKNGYTYYIGEYGAIQKKDPSDYSGWAEMSELFRKCGIPLALVWNYDPDEIIEYSFSEKSAEGKYILRTLKELNKEEP